MNNICSYKKKAADLRMENQVLVLKELIRSLGSNKTEHATTCITISKAALVIQDNLDQMVNVKSKSSSHKKNFFF